MSNTDKHPRLDLPPKPSAKKGKSEQELPTSLQLQQQRNEWFSNFQKRRGQDRQDLIQKIQENTSSKLLVFYSVGRLDQEKTEFLYELLQDNVGNREHIYLLLLSRGGYIEPAFNIALAFRRFAKEKFTIIVPSYAKSAATLLCLAADELIMGKYSELGPIDPRIDIPDEYGRMMNVSAISIRDAFKSIEKLTGNDNEKVLKYMPLIERISLKEFGELDRVIRSAKQYATDLLAQSDLLAEKNRKLDIDEKIAVWGKDNIPQGDLTLKDKVAHELTEGFYSHGYAIGPEKAEEMGFNISYSDNEGFDQNLWRNIWRLHLLYKEFIVSSARSKIVPNTNILLHEQIDTIIEVSGFSRTFTSSHQQVIKPG